VDLPSSNAQQQQRPQKPIFLTLKSDLSLTLGDTQTVPRGALAAAIDGATTGDKEQRLFLRADKSVPYGELMTLMNDLRSAGYLKIALVGMDAGQTSPAAAAPGAPATPAQAGQAK
jgi:biopolymer transport protein ExbD